MLEQEDKFSPKAVENARKRQELVLCKSNVWKAVPPLSPSYKL